MTKKPSKNLKSFEEIISRSQELHSTNLLYRSKKLYRDGDIVEAFVILYTLIEYELLYNWSSFAHAISNKGGSSIENDDNLDRRYMQHVQLFFEVGLLNKNEKKLFDEFHNARNKVVHELFHFKKGFDFNRKELNGKFRSGLKAASIIKLDVYYKIINQYVLTKFKDPNAPWEFKTPDEKEIKKITQTWTDMNYFGKSDKKSSCQK